MRLIRSSLPEAVEACIDAAGHEFDVSRQRTLLRAASYGQAFCRLVWLHFAVELVLFRVVGSEIEIRIHFSFSWIFHHKLILICSLYGNVNLIQIEHWSSALVWSFLLFDGWSYHHD